MGAFRCRCAGVGAADQSFTGGKRPDLERRVGRHAGAYEAHGDRGRGGVPACTAGAAAAGRQGGVKGTQCTLAVHTPAPPALSHRGAQSGVSTVSAGASLVSSISNTFTSGWSVLETILTDKPPAGEKDWCALQRACVHRACAHADAGVCALAQARGVQRGPQAEAAGRFQLRLLRRACCHAPQPARTPRLTPRCARQETRCCPGGCTSSRTVSASIPLCPPQP
jgi:hypothetical protein